MRTGHIDFDSGKWVDDPEESPSYKSIPTSAGYVHIPQTAKPAAEPAEPQTIADKARAIQARRQSTTGR